MQRAPRRDGDEIRPDRLPICKEYGDADMGRLIAGIKNSCEISAGSENELCPGM
jgi:hypothetical protein